MPYAVAEDSSHTDSVFDCDFHFGSPEWSCSTWGRRCLASCVGCPRVMKPKAHISDIADEDELVVVPDRHGEAGKANSNAVQTDTVDANRLIRRQPCKDPACHDAPWVHTTRGRG